MFFRASVIGPAPSVLIRIIIYNIFRLKKLNLFIDVAPCDYDQGAPLTQYSNYGGVQEEIVVGIMSKNLGCGDTTVPSIYTRLAAYYSWLLQTAGQQPANVAGRR